MPAYQFENFRCPVAINYLEETSYKKWYNEEYEFEIEVTGFYEEITQNIIAEMGKRLGINIPAPMDVRSIKMVRESAQKQ